MSRRALLLLLSISQAACLADSVAPREEEPVKEIEFLRDVRPILAEACFQCHGASRAEANLRIDRREDVLGDRRGQPIVIPGQPDDSLLYHRVTATALPMPPINAERNVSSRERKILRRWIEQGAPWVDHWAFETPVRSAIPEVSDPAWASNPIDAFVRARLDAEALAPSPPADPSVFARRLALDLTGLPPSLEEVDAFLADPEGAALASWIDRLASSERAAEHQAREWLDAARYADTHGFQLDLPRTMWAYRDWVIDAFATNLPYDRFLTEQLAGEGIATGFNRNHNITIEGGVIGEEYRAIYVGDRVDTFGVAMLGLSVGCARCHDHKYDPIKQREYYQLAACFNQTEERGLGAENGFAPTVQALSPLQEKELAAIDREVEEQSALLAGASDGELAAWENEAKAALPIAWTIVRPTRLDADNDTNVVRESDDTIIARNQEVRDAFEIDLEAPADTRALEIEGVPDPTQPEGGPGLGPGGTFTLTEVEAINGGASVAWAAAFADGAAPGFGGELAVDGDPTTGWMNDAPVSRRLVLIPEQPLSGAVHLRLHFGAGEKRMLGRFTLRSSTHPLAGMNAAMEGILAAPARTPDEQEQLTSFWLRHASPLRATARRVAMLRARRAAKERAPLTMIMRDRSEPTQTWILGRGRYDQPGAPVDCGVIETIYRRPRNLPANRALIAAWLVDRNHPLTARVAVNRIWQRFFGIGLVRTAEDFGTRAEPPSHPELLDWLAVELIESGWNLRRIVSLIASSRTYRQSSVVRADAAERDPENRLLWRGPRHRLAAEVIRDQALFASGLLKERLGGPSALPYQPPDLWEEVNDRPGLSVPYLEDAGDGRWRRSLYTFWKRTLPPPFLSTFDAPDREYAVVRRQVSNTPLQAIALLGEPGMIEAARTLALRMLDDGGAELDLSRAITSGFRRVLVRAPNAAELAELTTAHQEQRALLAADPDAAARLLQIGASRPRATHPAIDQAAMAQVARIILNLGESLTKE